MTDQQGRPAEPESRPPTFEALMIASLENAQAAENALAQRNVVLSKASALNPQPAMQAAQALVQEASIRALIAEAYARLASAVVVANGVPLDAPRGGLVS